MPRCCVLSPTTCRDDVLTDDETRRTVPGARGAHRNPAFAPVRNGGTDYLSLPVPQWDDDPLSCALVKHDVLADDGTRRGMEQQMAQLAPRLQQLKSDSQSNLAAVQAQFLTSQGETQAVKAERAAAQSQVVQLQQQQQQAYAALQAAQTAAQEAHAAATQVSSSSPTTPPPAHAYSAPLVDTRTIGCPRHLGVAPTGWAEWRFAVEAYVMAVHPDRAMLFKAAEAQGSNPIDPTSLGPRQRALSTPLYYMLVRLTTDDALWIVKTVTPGHGAEVWRRICWEYEPTIGNRTGAVLKNLRRREIGASAHSHGRHQLHTEPGGAVDLVVKGKVP